MCWLLTVANFAEICAFALVFSASVVNSVSIGGSPQCSEYPEDSFLRAFLPSLPSLMKQRHSDSITSAEMKSTRHSKEPPQPTAKPQGNPNVIVNINNIYYISGAQEVNVNPIKQQIVNVAYGNQIINLPSLMEDKPKPSIVGSTQLRSPPLHSGCSQESVAGSEGVIKVDHNTHFLKHGISQPFENVRQEESMNATSITEAFPLIGKNRVWHETGGISKPATTPLEKQTYGSRSEQQESNEPIEGRAPNMTLFVNGKQMTASNNGHQENMKNGPSSSKDFKEEIETLLLDGNKKGVGKLSFCFPDDAPTTCSSDLVVSREGLELSYDQIEKICDEITQRPGQIKLIVPGGVTGPLAGYFQKVELSRHEHALKHGVCLLDNGFLVPVKAMLRIVQLNRWLCQLSPERVSENLTSLHNSIKNDDLKSVIGLLQCFVRSGKVLVVLPSKKIVPFAQFEQHDRFVPHRILTEANVELLGFVIPYVAFKDSLFDLCKQ